MAAAHLARHLTQSDELLSAVASHPQFDRSELSWLGTQEAATFFQKNIFEPIGCQDSQKTNHLSKQSLLLFGLRLGSPRDRMASMATAIAKP